MREIHPAAKQLMQSISAPYAHAGSLRLACNEFEQVESNTGRRFDNEGRWAVWAESAELSLKSFWTHWKASHDALDGLPDEIVECLEPKPRTGPAWKVRLRLELNKLGEWHYFTAHGQCSIEEPSVNNLIALIRNGVPDWENTRNRILDFGRELQAIDCYKNKNPQELDVVESKVSREQWIAEAMMIVKSNPGLPDSKIAQMVNKSPSTLSRCKEYQAAAQMARTPKREIRRGHAAFDDDGKRSIEAYDDE